MVRGPDLCTLINTKIPLVDESAKHWEPERHLHTDEIEKVSKLINVINPSHFFYEPLVPRALLLLSRIGAETEALRGQLFGVKSSLILICRHSAAGSRVGDRQ